MRNAQVLGGALVVVLLLVVNDALLGQSLVTPDRIGRPNAPVTITWEAIPAYSLQNPFPARKEYLTQAAQAWAQKHPDVQIIPAVSAFTADSIGQTLGSKAAFSV